MLRQVEPNQASLNDQIVVMSIDFDKKKVLRKIAEIIRIFDRVDNANVLIGVSIAEVNNWRLLPHVQQRVEWPPMPSHI